MAEKLMLGRLVQKHDTQKQWERKRAANFIPLQGEIIVYDAEVDADGNTLELPTGRTEPYTYERFKIGDGIHTVSELPFAVDLDIIREAYNFDIVVTSEEEFKKCVYMLHPNKNEDGSVDLTTKGEPNLDFNYRYILVRGVDFTENLGSSDLDLAVLQPSIRYVKFDNCQWHCRWYLSGEEPTELNSVTKPTEYKRANGELNVIIDGIYVTEQNVIDSIPTEDDQDRYYYIGLRNFERIENCFIHYPKDYALLEEFNEDGTSAGFRYTFKFNLQYFNTIQNCKVTALWDGSNISGCRISERIVRCNNCSNILAEPIYRGGELYRVQMRESSNLSNIYGSPVIYTNCKAVDADTCSEYDAPKASEVDEFDLIITSMDDLATLPSNTTAKSVLVTGFYLSSSTKVPGFFTNTINATNEPYFVKFIIPKNIKYIKFSKSFYYNTARVVIQGHPDCILDGLPTITAPYPYTHCATLYDFKEVRNCYARGINTYTENDELVENATTVGISNVLMSTPNATSYPALASSYNYKKTRFINCDLSYINYAESVTNSRIIANAKMGYSPCIKNAATINGLKIYSISANQTVTLESCSHISNVDSNGYNIVYNGCTKVDGETCDNVPDSLITYVTKDVVDESIKDFVSNAQLKSSLEYDLIISSVDEFKALESNTTAVNVLVQNFGIYRANHVNGFFDNSASDYMYWTKFRIPANVKYIKFNNFKQNNSRVVIQGHEDCIIDGFPTVSSPYTPAKLYGNIVVLYNFKEVRNCCCANIHQLNAEGNYIFEPGVNGISNTILDMPYPAEEYSITISGEKININTADLAPDRDEQKTKFVNCDLMFVRGASTIENCRIHMGKLMADYIWKMNVPAISDVDLISGLTVQHIASNGKLTVENCNVVNTVNENGYTIEYLNCNGHVGQLGTNAVAFGTNTQASGPNSFASGQNTTASGGSSHAEGLNTKASGSNSHAEGWFTIASGPISHAEGDSSIAHGYYSHAEGRSGIAPHMVSGLLAKTDEEILANWNGQFSIALGESSHVEGENCIARTRSHAEGCQSAAIGVSAHSEGIDTTASGHYSHAEGNGTTASGNTAHAEGASTIASAPNAHAEGHGTSAVSDCTHAEGDNTTASSACAHAEGHKTNASGMFSHAEGCETVASGLDSHSEGESTVASGDASHAEGLASAAYGLHSHAEGEQTAAHGTDSHAEGLNTVTANTASHAEGKATIACGQSSHAEGYGDVLPSTIQNLTSIPSKEDIQAQWTKTMNFSIAYGKGSHVEGINSMALGDGSHAEGDNTSASAANAHAEGSSTSASAANAHAEGSNTSAISDCSHAEGDSTTTSSPCAHAEGYKTEASGMASHAEGSETKASGATSHSEGNSTVASGSSSHAEGYMTSASGQYAHAEGGNTVASGMASHAEGAQTTASGGTSHAEGRSSNKTTMTDDNSVEEIQDAWKNKKFTMAYGSASHAEGMDTLALGDKSHTEGHNTIASAEASHAGGLQTIASAPNSFAFGEGVITTGDGTQAVVGKLNNPNTNAYFIVGNGEGNLDRSETAGLSNAFEVLKDGRATVGRDPEAAMDVATKQYVDNKFTYEIKVLSKEDYNFMATKDPNTIYLIVPNPTVYPTPDDGTVEM